MAIGSGWDKFSEPLFEIIKNCLTNTEKKPQITKYKKQTNPNCQNPNIKQKK